MSMTTSDGYEPLAAAEEKVLFGIDAVTLAAIVQGHSNALLNELGGIKGIASKLKISIQHGVNSDESDDVQIRQQVFGSNTYREAPYKSFWMFVWAAMQDLTLIVLAICALVSFAVGTLVEGLKNGWCDGGGIAVSVLLVVVVTAASEYQQSLQFRALDKEKRKIWIHVTRSKRREKVSIYDLVVGDVVHLSIGDQIPADGVLVCGHSLIVDESCMTGESEPLLKEEEKSPFLISGSKVEDGSGIMMVTGVGMNTEWGHAMSILSQHGDDNHTVQTPLQVKLSDLAALIGKIGLLFAALTFGVLVVKYLARKQSWKEWSGADIINIVQFFATAVTMIVVAVPEGLPLSVTLSLAFAMKQMMSEKALVRHLSACETMGSATCICSDKTGTLTTNQMTVVKAWICGSVRQVYQSSNNLQLPAGSKEVIVEGIFQNTSGHVSDNGTVTGSPTESALLQLALDLDGGEFDSIRSQCEIVRVEPFNSAKKRMGVIVRSSRNKMRAHWKGASEIVLEMCDRYLDEDGCERILDDDKYLEVREVIKEMASEGLRTLCLTYKDDLAAEYSPQCQNIPEKGFVCAAIVGMKDPVRPGVREAVKMCMSAGIKVRMVTGDNLYTAMAIARECGILTDGDAVQGPEFRSWTSEEMRRRAPKLQVIARTSPSDKHKFVKELRGMGEIVAVTGDGTNDAPALYEADIGIAMGIAGTEVAKESADIVILDDNFASIVNVAKWGRSVYTNIQKFVQFQSTVNMVALGLNLWSACVKGSVALTVVEMLWVNLIMDTMAALALATESPQWNLMRRPPIGRKTHFVSTIMCRNVIVQAIYQLTVLVIVQQKGMSLFNLHGTRGTQVLSTIIFNSFVFFQVFNELNAREMEKVNVFKHMKNRIFLGIVGMTVVFQVILVEYMGKISGTKALNGREWMFCIVVGSMSLVVDVCVKMVHMMLRKWLGSKKRMSSSSASSSYDGCCLLGRTKTFPLIPKLTTAFFKPKSYHSIPTAHPCNLV